MRSEPQGHLGGWHRLLVQQFPNMITGVRIASAVIVWLGVPLMFAPELGRWLIRILFLLAAASDGLDGLLARKLGTQGKSGFYLDPIADKIFFNTMCLFLAFSENSPFQVRFPAWCAIGMLAKDVSWATGGLVIKWLTGRVDIPPSAMGKLTTASVVVLIGVLLVTPDFVDPTVAQELLWRGGVVCLALGAITLSGYAYQVFQSRASGHGRDGAPDDAAP